MVSISKEKFLEELAKIGKPNKPIANTLVNEMCMILKTADMNIVITALTQLALKFIKINEEGADEFVSTLSQMGDNSKKIKELEDNIKLLYNQNQELQKKLEISEKTLSSMNGNMVQREKVKQGTKIAYNTSIHPDKVLNMLREGTSISDIAKQLNVSRTLVYGRIAELKKAGIDVDRVISEGKQYKKDLKEYERSNPGYHGIDQDNLSKFRLNI